MQARVTYVSSVVLIRAYARKSATLVRANARKSVTLARHYVRMGTYVRILACITILDNSPLRPHRATLVRHYAHKGTYVRSVVLVKAYARK